MTADRKVVVKVTNVPAEGGKVTLSPEDAVPGVELTATLTDLEGGVSASGQITGEQWTWHRGAAADFTVNTNDSIATSPTYTPAASDVTMYLRAMVTYAYQGGDRKTGLSDAVQVQTSNENQAPRFKSARTFRVVAEDVAALATDDSTEDSTAAETDDNIGSPVAATDANGDTPTYSLSGADASLFRVRDNGQLEVKGKLDHEKKSSHTVTVTANDGSGGSNATASITVTIYVTDVNDAPKIRDRAASGANGQRTVTYRENGTGPVATFTASDPEGAMPVYWSVTATPDGEVTTDDIADGAFFEIDQNGVLSFKDSPNYEARVDAGTNNEYRVTVQADDGDQISYFEMYVDVTDEEEAGKATWTVNPAGDGTADDVPDDVVLRRFQPGASLTAMVTDPDAVTDSATNGAIADAEVTWKWYRGSSVIAGETGASYTVADGDAGSTIRVMATYSDGSGAAESVSLTSASVQGSRLDNDPPEFSPAAVTRRIAENSTGNIGGPVAATDADSDTLTYAIGDGNDGDSFRIDPATGQLMVGPDLMINFEDADNTSYIVNVVAYDSSGDPSAPGATVTINVINVEEKPTFNVDVPAENPMRATVAENAEDEALNIGTYTAMDPEDEEVSLSLVGDDASLFELADDIETGNDVSQVLSFKKSPDFEMPGDRNDDNLYEVTVRASDAR